MYAQAFWALMKVHLYDVVSCMVEIVMNLKLGSQVMVQVLIISNLKCPVEELWDYWAIAPSTYNLKGYKSLHVIILI